MTLRAHFDKNADFCASFLSFSLEKENEKETKNETKMGIQTKIGAKHGYTITNIRTLGVEPLSTFRNCAPGFPEQAERPCTMHHARPILFPTKFAVFSIFWDIPIGISSDCPRWVAPCLEF
jgi:hypothetical protein